MEAAVPAEEGGVGEEALPELADEGGAEEAAGLVRREAEEDLSDGVVGQLRRREMRRHGAGVLGAEICVGGGIGEGEWASEAARCCLGWATLVSPNQAQEGIWAWAHG